MNVKNFSKKKNYFVETKCAIKLMGVALLFALRFLSVMELVNSNFNIIALLFVVVH